LQKGAPAAVYNDPNDIYTAQILGNAVVVSKEDALKLGITTDQQKVMFYPEWVELSSSWNSRRFEVLDIYYKGFYEELLLERNGVKIRAIQLNRGAHKKNDHVQANIGRFIGYE